MKYKNVKIIKKTVFFLVTILIVILVIQLIPFMKELSTLEGQTNFKHKVDELGFLGMLLLFGLQLAQIVLVILPGEPIELLAGMCYGSIGGAIFIFTSIFIISSGIYFLVKTYGKKYIYLFFKKEKIDKIEKSKIFNNTQKIEIILIILFLIPGTPKDFLIYLGALLPLKSVRFLLIATFARFPSVISSTIAGENLSFGNWKTTIVIYAVTFVITGVFIYVINKLDKNKLTKKAINELK